jgi:hypothetical protein
LLLEHAGRCMSKRLHVGLGVFAAVWNVAASVLFAGGIVSPRTLGTVVGLLGLPLLVLGGADRSLSLPSGAVLDAERTIGLGDAFVGTGIVLAMTIPVVVGPSDSTDQLVALLSIVAGGTLAVMGVLVAVGRYGLPE